MKQTSHPPQSRDSESLNKTTVWCGENGHQIPNTLNISHSSPSDKFSSDCALSGPLCEFSAWSRIIPMWQLPSQIPTVYHLNDSGGHLSPWLIVSATRTWHLSIAVRVIFHWWFSSALWSSLCKTLLSLIYVCGETDPSWMKQKGVKYHNPINTEVCWQVALKRSAKNAQKCNQSQTGVKL